MADDSLRYDRMVERALRSVVREALRETAERGLPGAHHFYITFRTGFPGVVMPDWLRASYPEDITIVLQYQFWGLEAGEDRFAVTLSFNGRDERLEVPYEAVTAFADPSVKFGLQFESAKAVEPKPVPDPSAQPEKPSAPAAEDKPDQPDGDGAAKVVTLDAFRKK